MSARPCHVSFYVNGPLFPVSQGSQRVIVELARYLHRQADLSLRLIVQAPRKDGAIRLYEQICDEVVWLDPMPRFSIWSVLNSAVSRLGIDLLRGWGLARALRPRLMSAIKGSDWVVLNYAVWGHAVTRKVRRAKTMVVTHDLMFYRRASFNGVETLFKRWQFAFNRWCELHFLRSFKRVAVFADYEEKLLLERNFPAGRIVRLGMPIAVPDVRSGADIRYDFVVVGGNSLQNEEGVRTFFERVVPLLGSRRIALAVVGGICSSRMWDDLSVPDTICVTRLGRVDDVQSVYAQSLIGVGTVPHGSGIKVKVVETLMSGLPMVLTDSGEEGVPVDAEGGVNIDRVSPGEARQRILRWLDSPQAAREAGRRVAEQLKTHFAPDICLAGLSRTLKEVD